MGAANVPMSIDQGEDWTTNIIYSDEFDNPYNIVPPCRMDIKSPQGATQITLATPEGELPDGVIPEIMLSSEIGLIQLHIEDGATAAMIPGVYKYDLFVTINDGNDYAGDQIQRLIRGDVTVNQRVTEL
jgi:hypothetical protein